MKTNLLTHAAKGQTYQEFQEMVASLLGENRTTGPNQSEAYVHYTKMNEQRMLRLDKTIVLDNELEEAVKSLKHDYSWLVLVEAWCGDVPQNIPLMAKLAELNPKIELRFILRDENPEIMDGFLTNGGRAIPKLIITRKDTAEVAATWGPRPAPAQQMVMDYKALPDPKPDYMEMVKQAQLWYSKDKTRTQQAEFLELIQGLE